VVSDAKNAFPDGAKVLRAAAAAKATEAALLDNGAGPAFSSGLVSGEQTPLLLAAKYSHADVMRALIKAGADPKAKAQDRTTLAPGRRFHQQGGSRQILKPWRHSKVHPQRVRKIASAPK
jgi:hypothetical protein